MQLQSHASRRRGPYVRRLRGWARRAMVEASVLASVLLLIWGGIWLQLSQERVAAERGAIKETGNLALAFEENIVRSINAIDQVVLIVRDSYARDPARFDLQSWARDRPFLCEYLHALN